MLCGKRNTGRLSARTWLLYCTRMMRYYAWCGWEGKPYNLINFFINWKDKTYKSCVRSALRLSFLIKQIVLSLVFWNLSFCAKNMSCYTYVVKQSVSLYGNHIIHIVWFLSEIISYICITRWKEMLSAILSARLYSQCIVYVYKYCYWITQQIMYMFLNHLL